MMDAFRAPGWRLLPLVVLLLGVPARESASAATSRVLPPVSPRATRLATLGRKLGTRPPRMEDPCVASTGPGCATALAPFFTALDTLAAGSAPVPVVIAAFGNSLIAGDRIVDVVRQELAGAFGDGGRGVLLADRLAPYGPRARSGHAQGGWEARTLGEMKPAELPFGISGVYHQALAPKARSRFALEGERQGTLWWFDAPGGGPLYVHVDGHPLTTTLSMGDGQAHALPFTLPEGARELELVAGGKGAVVLGVVLQRPRPGIVLDTLGVPSADANLFLRAHEDIFRAQLVERDPRLLLFILGGNETKRLEWRRSEPEEVERGLRALLRRSRAAVPGAACLVVGPIDAVRTGKGSERLVQRPYLTEVLAMERQVALAEGCAFFDLFSAMGGSGSLARFLQAGLVHDDLVHPRGQGLDLLGQLLTDALLRAWVEAGEEPLRTTEVRP